MKFYLNQKSLPMIRKCLNCTFFNDKSGTCKRFFVFSAYDYNKKMNLHTGENLYCPLHQFKNEDVLKAEAIEAEFATVQDAMDVINAAKTTKEIKHNHDNS